MEEQIQLERDASLRGRERYFGVIQGNEDRGRGMENSVASSAIADAVHALLPEVRRLKSLARKKHIDAMTTGRRLSGWELPLLTLSSEVIAYVTVKRVVVSAKEERRLQQITSAVGRLLNLELKWQEAREEESKLSREEERPSRIAEMKRKVRQIDPKSVKKWLKKMDDLTLTEWPGTVHFTLGSALVAAFLEACPEVVTKRSYVTRNTRGARTTRVVLELTPEFTQRLMDGHADAAANSPWLLPMIAPPRDWQPKVPGGYHLFEFPVVKRTRFNHTKSTVPASVMEALNRVQATPWAINDAVYDIAYSAVRGSIGPLPVQPLMDMPEIADAETWAKMSRGERGKVKRKREEVHSHNNRQIAKGLAMHRVLNVAKEFRDRTIWFPHNIDWRGRAYPLPQDLHPQADDFAKGMLRFAGGKPLGEHGMKWLVFHLANCYGMDKVDRQGQADWFNDHMNEVYLVATEPFGAGLEFWSEADEPWQFLAACLEICCAWTLDDPSEYVSTLPVHVDGSCNGLQHLSAMGLDPVGAEAVNLTPGSRRDIYQIVADKVLDAVDGDAIPVSLGGNPSAMPWVNKVTRKTVKRGVMTTPYGVTPIGLRDQLLKDRWCEGLEGDPMENANYMRDRMQDAIVDTIQKGTEIMHWLQQCAEILAKKGKPISWTTPMGLRVTQNYQMASSKTVYTLLGRYEMAGKAGGAPRTRKQMLSIAPNLIHSFDAAHMMMAVLAAPEGMSFSVIHDSFGCHAGDMEEFGHVIRQQFVKIYETDWFWSLRADFEQQGSGELPEAPERGLFDIGQVLDAEFFFA